MSARELGNPLGNPLALKRKSGGAKTLNPTIVDFVNGAAGSFVIPDGFSFFRVTTVGGGAGGGNLGPGGGGGGLSRSPILKAKAGAVIDYVAGMGGAVTLPGTDSTAAFGDFSLLATGGKSQAGAGLGGIGSGGVDNFQGGSGGQTSAAGAGGGGSAGPTSNGGAGGASTTTTGGDSVDGGGGGASGYSTRPGSGGGGVMAPGGAGYNIATTRQVQGGVTRESWGSPGGFGMDQSLRGIGGNWGGGGGASGNNTATYPAAPGGFGGVRIELW